MQLFEIFDLQRIKAQYAIESYKLIDFAVGYDDIVYLLFCEKEPKRISGSFVDTQAQIRFAAVLAYVNWENEELEGGEFRDLGVLPFNYYMIRPLDGMLALVGSRCWNRDDGVDLNVLLLDKTGKVQKRFCCGDGIEDCITTPDGRLITGYFDEGVFGNLGWVEPIGAPGLIVWDSEGQILWKNTRRNICDCYAMNLDTSGKLWFYYYTDYDLVCTDFSSDVVFDPETEECNAFALSQKRDYLLHSGGWNEMCFYKRSVDMQRGRLGPKEKTEVLFAGSAVTNAHCHASGAKLLFLLENGILAAHWLR